MSQTETGRADSWDFWIDRGGTFTDVSGARPDGTLARPQAAVGESRRPIATPPCRASASCSGSRPASRSRPARSAPCKMGTTVATNALLERKGERTLLRHHRGLPRRAADRLPGAARHLRQAHRQAGACSTSASSRSTSACAPTARWSAPLDLGAVRGRACGGAAPTASARSPSCSCTPIAIPSTSGAWRRSRARWASRRSRSATRSRRWSSSSAAATPPWSTPISRRSCAATWRRWRRSSARRRRTGAAR